MSPQLQELWLEHAVAAFDRQLHLAEWLGEHDWQWETHSGQLLLRRHEPPQETFSFSTQALGSESQMSETWMWIWANDLAELPDEVLRSAHQLRDFGAERSIPEFTQSEFPLIEADGHVLSCVASGLLQSAAYYRGPYLGGAGFVLIDDARFPRASLPDATRVVRVLSEAVVSLPIDNHRRASLAYLHQLGWLVEENGHVVVGQAGGHRVEACFDAANHLLELNSVAQPQSLQN